MILDKVKCYKIYDLSKILWRIILYLRFQVYSNTGQIIYSSDKNHKFVPKWRNNPCLWDKTETCNIFCWLLAKHHLAVKTFIIESGNNERGRIRYNKDQFLVQILVHQNPTLIEKYFLVENGFHPSRITFSLRRRSRFTVKKSHSQENKII